MDIKKTHSDIVAWIKDWFSDKPNGKAVIGISGGKDSAVCAGLLVEALGKERVVGVLMPNGEQKDISDSYKVCEYLGVKPIVVNIGGTYEEITSAVLNGLGKELEKMPALYTTNTPARLRMVTLYGIAACVGGFVCNTCNLSEDWIGYSTKWGDAVGDFSLLNKLTKTEVVALGDEMGLPKDLVHKTPSDGMCGKSDEDNLGFTYDQLDRYIRSRFSWGDIDTSDIPQEVIEKINRMHNSDNNRYKCVPLQCPFLYGLCTAY